MTKAKVPSLHSATVHAVSRAGATLLYDLERLGALGFQDAAAALTIAQFGPVVRRLGRGKDGGRDMEARGTVIWSRSEQQRGEVWDGFTVFQVKHLERPMGTKADARSLWDAIRDELNAWADPDSNRREVPNYLVFVTNVRLSPEPEHGGLDYIENNIVNHLADIRDRSQDAGPSGGERRLRRERLLPLEEWKVIDGNQVESWFDRHEGVRRAYGGFLTSGDCLADLASAFPGLRASELEPALQTHARNSLIRDRRVYFDEAGGDGAGVPLDQIVVDLPVRVRTIGKEDRAIRHVLDRGEHVLKRSVATFAKPRHVVLTGAPGNGKTTITRFLVQSYRAALLTDTENLADDHHEVIDGTAGKLKLLQRALPHHRRWPVRVDLAEFAREYRTAGRKSLMAFIAQQITTQGYGKSLEPWILKQWMAAWSWFVALDGLDEVAEPGVRKWVLSCVHEFVADAEADDADVLVLVTTRPTGYVDELFTSQFDRIDLSDLPVAEALAYGHLVTATRLGADVSRIKRVDDQLMNAARNDNLRHLLRTPLQVQIMSIIAEGAGPLDPDRFRLFWRYYDVVARREQSKENTRYAQLLREHAEQVLDLHERVGLELQRRSETADGGTASLAEGELSDIAWRVLADEGYAPAGKDSALLERIVEAATHRLVLLIPRGDGYGFDVRSLQEMMAARRITTGELPTVLEKLRLLGPSPHWRNTWLFAAGRMFSEPQVHQHDALIRTLVELDDVSDRFSTIAPVGPYLAWDVLDDGMAASRPRRLTQLVAHGMKALEYPAPQPVDEFAEILMRMSEFSDELRLEVRDALRSALGGDSSTRANAEAVQREIERLASTIPTSPDVRLLAQAKRTPGGSLPPDLADGWAYLGDVVNGLASDELSERVRGAVEVLRATQTRFTSDSDIQVLEEVALNPEATELLEVALERLVRTDEIVAMLCFQVARTTTARRKLGGTIVTDGS